MFRAVMARIEPSGVEPTDRAHGVRAAALVVLLTIIAGCGNDPGGPFVMPPGEAFDAIGSDLVVVTTESQNYCSSLDVCVPQPASRCDLGDGNVRGLSVYRLGRNGNFLSLTGDRAGAIPEETIATGNNPRRVIAHPSDPTLLYVATQERVQVFRLRPGGGSACIDETLTDDEIVPDLDRNEDLDPFDLFIDPDVGTFGVLYIAANGVGRIDAYEIASDGTLPSMPTSCVIASRSHEFSTVQPINSTLFATGSQDRVEIFERVDGQFPDVQSTTPTPTPTSTPFPGEPTPDATETPASTGPLATATPSPAPTCVDALLITDPLSSLGAGLVTDIDFLASSIPGDDTIGSLIVAEETSQRLISFPVDPNGQIDGDDNGRTDRSGYYQRMLRIDRNGITFYYATAFQEGKTDVHQLGPATDEDRWPSEVLAKTRSDPFSLPVGLMADGSEGSILYVAQEGLGRIDGFRILTDGSIEDVPTTSTADSRGLGGQTLELFQNDVAIVPLP